MHKLLEPYAALVPFLGVALGDNVEVALHDLLQMVRFLAEKLVLSFQICLFIIQKQNSMKKVTMS